MGHSTTHFRGASFTTKDWKLAVWLHLLARQIDEMLHSPDWLKTARDHWREQATLSINGCISPSLDTFLTDEERIETFTKLVQRNYSALLLFGDKVPRDFLNSLCQLPPQLQFPEDIPTELLLACGRALLKLLGGKMKGH